MNVWIRRLGAAAMASPAFLTSEGFARASEQTVELRITLEIAQMDSKSPAETFMPHFSDAQISTIFVARYNNDNCKRQAFYFRYNPS